MGSHTDRIGVAAFLQLLFFLRDKGNDSLRQIHHRHGLQPDLSWALQSGQEETFPAKQYILETRDCLE